MANTGIRQLRRRRAPESRTSRTPGSASWKRDKSSDPQSEQSASAEEGNPCTISKAPTERRDGLRMARGSAVLVIAMLAVIGCRTSVTMYEGTRSRSEIAVIKSEVTRWSRASAIWYGNLRAIDGTPLPLRPVSVRVLPGRHVATVDCYYVTEAYISQSIRSFVDFQAEAGERYEISCRGPEQFTRPGALAIEVRKRNGALMMQREVCWWEGRAWRDSGCRCEGEHCLPHIPLWDARKGAYQEW